MGRGQQLAFGLFAQHVLSGRVHREEIRGVGLAVSELGDGELVRVGGMEGSEVGQVFGEVRDEAVEG